MTPMQDPSPGPYAGSPGPYPPYPQEGARGGSKGKGLLGKIMGKVNKPPGAGGAYGQPQYAQQGYPPQQSYMGPPQGYAPQGYPPQQYGHPGYGAPPGGYGYPQQQYGGYQQRPMQGKKPGMGGAGMMAGGAALGVGAGMLGGAMLANSYNDAQEEAYEEGYGEF